MACLTSSSPRRPSRTVDNFTRTVEHVGLKTTRVRALGGEQIIIANAEPFRNTVYDYRHMSTRRKAFTLRASPSTPRGEKPAANEDAPGASSTRPRYLNH